MIILIVVLLAAVWFIFGDAGESGTQGKWQAIYYPDGCLSCEDQWIFSPFFEEVNQCIAWIHNRADSRDEPSDAAECAYDCRQECDISCWLVCDETIDVLGKASL